MTDDHSDDHSDDLLDDVSMSMSVNGGEPVSFTADDLRRVRDQLRADEADAVLLDVAHGSRLSRGWLAGSAAAGTDDGQPGLYRVTNVEEFDGGFRFSSTDAYWTASAWVGDPVDPTDPLGEVIPPPTRGEIPTRTVAVVDVEYRIRDLMRFVARRTKEVAADKPDVPIVMSICRDRDEQAPTLDPSFDRDRVDVQIPHLEQVAGSVSEVAFPDVARLNWQFDADDTVELDEVYLAPRLLRSLAAAATAVGSSGVRFGFHGDPAKPISWEALQPAAAVLSGLVMPPRRPGADQ
jgi:hypothetical protein